MVLVGAISLQSDTIPSNSSDSQPNQGSGGGSGGDGIPTHQASRIGPVVGGVIGGLSLLALVIGLYFMIRKRRETKNSISITSRPPLLEPFPVSYNSVLPSSTATRSVTVYPTLNRREKSNASRPDPSDSNEPPPPPNKGMTSVAGGSHTSPSSNSRDGRPADLSSGVAESSSGAANRGEGLPTLELLRLLNNRLWPDDAPPEYTSRSQS